MSLTMVKRWWLNFQNQFNVTIMLYCTFYVMESLPAMFAITITTSSQFCILRIQTFALPRRYIYLTNHYNDQTVSLDTTRSQIYRKCTNKQEQDRYRVIGGIFNKIRDAFCLNYTLNKHTFERNVCHQLMYV